MIKSTKQDKKAQPNKDKYPCLMEGSAGTIVLMTAERKGMVVDGCGLSKFNTVGTHTNGWDMSNFFPYEGKIILENK